MARARAKARPIPTCQWIIPKRDGTWRKCPNRPGSGPFKEFCPLHAEWYDGMMDRFLDRQERREHEAYGPPED